VRGFSSAIIRLEKVALGYYVDKEVAGGSDWFAGQEPAAKSRKALTTCVVAVPYRILSS
jgi:hypothetical protein